MFAKHIHSITSAYHQLGAFATVCIIIVSITLGYLIGEIINVIVKRKEITISLMLIPIILFCAYSTYMGVMSMKHH